MSELVIADSLSLDAFSQAADTFKAAAPVAASGGHPFLKMMRTGDWVYGADGVAVSEDSEWVIPRDSLMQGFIAWHAGKVEGEQVSVIGQPTVDESKLPPVQAKNGWERQVGCGLVGMSGEDEGVTVQWKTNTHGGREAFNKVFDAIVKKNHEGVIAHPIVKLSHAAYNHSEYGTVRKPVLEVVGWHEPKQLKK